MPFLSRAHPETGSLPDAVPLWSALAEFRYHLRLFTLVSERAAQSAGLQPQQYQLLLQIAGCDHASSATVAFAAGRLGLRHNSTVELVNRSVSSGLLTRTPDPNDGRGVLLRMTPKGEDVLRKLAGFHSRELYERSALLISSLDNVRNLALSSGASNRQASHRS